MSHNALSLHFHLYQTIAGTINIENADNCPLLLKAEQFQTDLQLSQAI